MEIPGTRYARTADGDSIAYQVVGDGPFDLCLAASSRLRPARSRAAR